MTTSYPALYQLGQTVRVIRFKDSEPVFEEFKIAEREYRHGDFMYTSDTGLKAWETWLRPPAPYTLDDKLRALHEDNVNISRMLVMLAKDVHALARPIPKAALKNGFAPLTETERVLYKSLGLNTPEASSEIREAAEHVLRHAYALKSLNYGKPDQLITDLQLLAHTALALGKK